jgi:hypothetical protein
VSKAEASAAEDVLVLSAPLFKVLLTNAALPEEFGTTDAFVLPLLTMVDVVLALPVCTPVDPVCPLLELVDAAGVGLGDG